MGCEECVRLVAGSSCVMEREEGLMMMCYARILVSLNGQTKDFYWLDTSELSSTKLALEFGIAKQLRMMRQIRHAN